MIWRKHFNNINNMCIFFWYISFTCSIISMQHMIYTIDFLRKYPISDIRYSQPVTHMSLASGHLLAEAAARFRVKRGSTMVGGSWRSTMMMMMNVDNCGVAIGCIAFPAHKSHKSAWSVACLDFSIMGADRRASFTCYYPNECFPSGKLTTRFHQRTAVIYRTYKKVQEVDSDMYSFDVTSCFCVFFDV